MSLTTIYLALGSNLGDRAALLAAARDGLTARGVPISAESPLYQTDAVADHPQPPYLNQVLRARTHLSPRALLTLCLEIESAHGRVRPADRPRAARTLDIDILLYGNRVIKDASLIIPHPAMLARGFVRIPLAQVAVGGLRHPVTRERLDVASVDPRVHLHEIASGQSPPRRE